MVVIWLILQTSYSCFYGDYNKISLTVVPGPMDVRNVKMCKWLIIGLVGRSWYQFPLVSLDFSVTYFLPTVPWPWGRLSL